MFKGGYEFTAEVTHGFPTQPSAFDYDPILEIAAIGTKNGCLRVFGAPGIELTGACEEDAAVLKATGYFLEGFQFRWLNLRRMPLLLSR